MDNKNNNKGINILHFLFPICSNIKSIIGMYLLKEVLKLKGKKEEKKGGYLPFGHIGNLLLYLDPFPATFHQGQCIFASEDKQQKQAGVRKILRKKN